MYNPVAFRELRPEIIEEAMGAHPLATLVTIGTQGLIASHLPLLYYRAEGVSPDGVLPDGVLPDGVLPDGVLGFLRGHLARANPQWQDSLPSSEALAIFNGPQHYVSPTWYPSTSEHGKVVPTWNYVTVHAHGTVSFKTDADWLLENVRALTDAQEKSNEAPWRVEDAPREFIENSLKAIVGVELKITRLEGKWKTSQNRSVPDREGVIAGLQRLDSQAAGVMAELVKDTLPK